MKKPSVSAIILLTIGMILFGICANAEAQSTPDKNPLMGTWQLCGQDSLISNRVNGIPGMSRYKIISDQTFIVADMNNDNKVFLGDFFGTYSVENNIYNEKIEYSHPSLKKFIGKTNSFYYEIKNDLLFIKGINNNFDEIWRRIK